MVYLPRAKEGVGSWGCTGLSMLTVFSAVRFLACRF